MHDIICVSLSVVSNVQARLLTVARSHSPIHYSLFFSPSLLLSSSPSSSVCFGTCAYDSSFPPNKPMAEAARTVKPYVSDCLQERHPYDVQKGFGGRAARDAGKVFKGFLPGGLHNSIQSLSDPSISEEEKAKAVRHLYAQSASQESKIVLLEKDIVPLVVSVVRQCELAALQQQCFLLLRSLCVIPQGCYNVVYGGGIDAAVATMSGDKADVAPMDVRVAAAGVVQQTAFDYAGVRWLLQAEDCDEMRLRHGITDTVEAGNLVSTEALIDVLAHVLEEAEGGADARPLDQAVMATLSSLTGITAGITGCIASDACMQTLAQHLTEIGRDGLPLGGARLQFAVPLLDTVWNIAMDQTGVEALEARGVPGALLGVFTHVCDRSQMASTLLQRHLMGALSAVFKLTSMKRRCAEPLGTSPSLAAALLGYLRSVNEQVDTAKHAGKEPSKDIVAISKNTVQCIRLASEVKGVRDITHAYINTLEAEGGHEAFYLRRQLYYSTIWEAEYNASV